MLLLGFSELFLCVHLSLFPALPKFSFARSAASSHEVARYHGRVRVFVSAVVYIVSGFPRPGPLAVPWPMMRRRGATGGETLVSSRLLRRLPIGDGVGDEIMRDLRSEIRKISPGEIEHESEQEDPTRSRASTERGVGDLGCHDHSKLYFRNAEKLFKSLYTHQSTGSQIRVKWRLIAQRW